MADAGAERLPPDPRCRRHPRLPHDPRTPAPIPFFSIRTAPVARPPPPCSFCFAVTLRTGDPGVEKRHGPTRRAAPTRFRDSGAQCKNDFVRGCLSDPDGRRFRGLGRTSAGDGRLLLGPVRRLRQWSFVHPTTSDDEHVQHIDAVRLTPSRRRLDLWHTHIHVC